LPRLLIKERIAAFDSGHRMTHVPRLTTKILAAFFMLSASTAVAFAEDCRAFPPGPDRHACAMREHPDRFGAKLEHCKQLAGERGFTEGAGAKRQGGMRDFVQACVQGRQQ
jgi:hypothetical protein